MADGHDVTTTTKLELSVEDVAQLRRLLALHDAALESAKPRTQRRWRQRSAVLAGVGLAGALAMGVAVASTPGNPADVTFISLSVPHKILSNVSIAKGATNSTVVNGASTTVPTDATSVQMTVAVKSTTAGSLSVFPTDHAASTSADTINFAAGNVVTTQVTKQNPGLAGKVSFKNNGTATAVVTVTITGYSTQTTASNVSGSGGSAGQVLTNNGIGASWGPGSLSLNAGYGLAGGGTVALGGTSALSVDASVVQNRVTGTCTSGKAITSVNQSGGVSCVQVGVKTVGGAVNADGTTAFGSGFSVVRTGTGHYTITFPSGTWNGVTIPAMTVSPWGAFGAPPAAYILTEAAAGDGSATFNIVTYQPATSTPADNPWQFVAVQT